MKIETPLLRWHQEMNPSRKQDENANGPIRSCSLLTLNNNVGILATAGNAEVNLWRVGFTADETRLSSNTNNTTSSEKGAQDGASTKNDDGAQCEPTSHILVQPVKNKDEEPANKAEHTQIKHIVTLSRGTSERAINAVKFSPSGQYLVAVGDAGTIVVWTIPQQTTSKANHSFWSNLEEEKDLPMKILFNHTDDVMDVAWSADSKRFTVCSLDHTMNVWEMKDDWKKVINKDKEHTHYIQGVAYDPKGVYLASMGSDRMVKVYTRKSVSKNVIKGELEKYVTADKPTTTTVEGGGEEEKKNGDGEKQQQQKVKETPEEKEKKHAIVQNQILPEVFANNKFELQKGGTKTIKFFSTTSPSTKTNAAAAAPSNVAEGEEGNKESTPTKTNNTGNAKRHHMFADELTLGSFFRRLSFTTDGAFLVVPAALWHGRDNSSEGKQASPTSVGAVNKLDESSFATYLFARHHFDQPYKVLAGLEKPSVAIRPNPVLYQLPPNSTASALPYRSIFAVLTSDTVLIYDTHHNKPLAMANGLHFATLTDATWSNDGNTLFVTSSDGYISILNFGKGELGEVYEAPAVNVAEKVDMKVTDESKAIPANKEEPKLNAAVVNTLVPKKKEKKSTEEAQDTVVTDTAVSEEASTEKKSVSFDEPLDDRSNQPVAQPVINTLIPKKKKKKIAPTAVQPESAQQTSTTDVSGGEKRSVEEVSSTVEPVVNILVAKKKQKVAESSIPATTM